MLFNGLLLLMLVTILILFYAAVVIYGRNPYRIENRATSLVMVLLLLLAILDFAQLFVVQSDIVTLTAALKYPVALLAAGGSVWLHLIFTRNYHRIPKAVGILAALLPFVIYEIQLQLDGSSCFIAAVNRNGRWWEEQPASALCNYLAVIGAYAWINLALARWAWRRSDVHFDKKHFLVLYRANILFLIASVVCLLVYMAMRPGGQLPSTIMLLPALVWGVSISLMMIKNDFLPSLSRKYELLFRMSPAPIIILNQHARILEANPRAWELLANGGGAIPQLSLAAIFNEADGQPFHDLYFHQFPTISWQGKEMALQGADGSIKTILIDMEMIAENGEPYAIAIIRDITQRKYIEKHTEFLAYHDRLTALPNRYLFKKTLEAALMETNDATAFNAVLLVDLDRFKLINDTLGHQSGDEVLKVVAGRFRECLNDGSILARAGGDEFMILVRGASEYDELIRIAEQLQAVAASPVTLFGSEYYLTASIGISLFPGDGATVNAIIKNADIAMYHAKSNGGSQYRFFSKELNTSIQRMVDMEASLRRALEEDEFFLLYQPQTDIESGATIGAEALVRWNSKQYGVVSPADFIPLAEQTGLILKLGQWVLEEACREAKRWEQAGWDSMTVSVNVSAKQFMQPDFADGVKAVLNHTGLDARKLCIEITESVVIDKLMFTLKMLDELVGMGIKISMDDFGTGYSSLSILRQLPISAIKIDKSFTAEMAEVHSVRAVVAAIITMTHHLGKTVVAEGIESEQQLAWLREMGCDTGQGYYIDKPLSAEMMLARLKTSS